LVQLAFQHSWIFLKIRSQQYLRNPDPELAIPRWLRSTYSDNATVPADAIDTGFRRNGRAVWLSAGESSAYVISDERIERWPGAAEPIYCA
jgi:hypothetical protein